MEICFNLKQKFNFNNFKNLRIREGKYYFKNQTVQYLVDGNKNTSGPKGMRGNYNLGILFTQTYYTESMSSIHVPTKY